jgi:glycosyltransferase involved in cell wall biosynthesis
MKILSISNLYPPYYLGGYELRCEQVCRGLAERGHGVTVLASTFGCERETVECRNTIDVHRRLALLAPFGQAVPGPRFGWRLLRVARRNHAATRTLIREIRPDLVIAWNQLRLSGGPVRAACDAKVPLAFSLGDTGIMKWIPGPFRARPRQLVAALLERGPFRRALIPARSLAAVHCTSATLKRRLLTQGLPIAAAQVIHRGIPLERFPVRTTDDPTPVRLLYVGRLEIYKGAHVILDALARLEPTVQAAFTLTMVGSGSEEYRHRLERQAASLLTPTEFLGHVDHGRLPAIYRQHDVFVLPSMYEDPFPATPLEAMASGVTVVSTRGGGQDEYLVHGENALVFDRGDAPGLGDCLRWILAHPEATRQLALRGRALVEQRFSSERYLDEMERFVIGAACGHAG